MKIPEDQSLFKKVASIVLVLMGLALLIVFFSKMFHQFSLATGKVSADEQVVYRAEIGRLYNTVTAFGELQSASRRSLVAQVAGTITEIHVQPGARVESNTVILSLSNPQLERELESVRLELDEAKAAQVQLNVELSNQEQMFAGDVLITEAELSIQTAELEAKETLAAQQIISQSELRRERVLFQQSSLKLHLAKQKMNTFRDTKKARENVAALKVRGVETLLQIKQADIEALKVVAGMSGVLQSINSDVELGQRLNQGENIGVVANLDTLYAEVRVGASEVANVAVGMPVNLDIKGMPATGVVNRVAPNVVRNQVQVDVAITSELPITARPDVEVQAAIVLNDKDNIIVIPRPSHFKLGFPLQLYVKTAADRFELRTVKVGLASNEQVEILAGLALNDELLLVNPQKFKQQKIIKL